MSDTTKKAGLPYKWRVLISVIFGIFMVILDTTVVNVAFQTLRRDFGANLNDAQWIISVYVLSLGISTPMSGFLADRFGIKRMYVVGLGLFVLGSFMCGVAPNLWFLVAARALQGVGGGIALPLGTAFLFNAFPPEEQGVALGIFGIALVLAPALGPILGGFLVDQDWWRAIFFINLPIGLLGIFLASRWLKEQLSDHKPPLDILGLVTSALGFGAVLYAASIAADEGWTSTKVLTWFAVGGVSLVAMIFIELFVAKEPLLDLRLFKKSRFTVASLIGWVSVIALFGAEFLLPVYLQALRGYTALRTGFILLPLAATAGVFTPLAGRLYDKIGPRPLIVVGFGVLLLNTWQLSLLEADTPISWILFLLALRGMALGMTVQTTLVAALSVVPLSEVARGSALVNATRQVVQSIGVAVLATILASTISQPVKELQDFFQNQAAAAPAAASAASGGICSPQQGPPLGVTAGGPPSGAVPGSGQPGVAPGGGLPAGVPNITPELVQRACAENIAGFERAYRFTFYVAIVAAFLGLFLPGWPLKWAGRENTGGAPVAAGH